MAEDNPEDWEVVEEIDAEEVDADDWETVSEEPVPRSSRKMPEPRYKPKHPLSGDVTKSDTKKNPMSEPESFLRGARSSVTFDFDDEIGGAIAAVVPGGKGYKDTRDEIRELKKKAFDENPISYTGGALAGGLVVPGLGAAKGVGALGKLGAAVKSGAGYGAVSGLGGSDAEDVGGMAADTAKGGLVGGAIGGAFNIAGKAIQAPTRMIPDSLKEKAYKKIGEIDDDMAQVIKERPQLVKKAKDAKGSLEISEDLIDKLEKMKKEQTLLDRKAWETLAKVDRTAPKFDAANLAKSKLVSVALEKNLVSKGQKEPLQGAQIAALRKLKAAAADVEKAKSYSDLKAVIQRIDKNTKWGNPDETLNNDVLQRYRIEIDRFLKEAVPDYRRDMQPVDQISRTLKAFQRKFGVEKGSEIIDDVAVPRLQATDRTIGRIETMRNQAFQDKQGKTKQALSKYAPEVLDDIEAGALQKYMDRDVGRGFRTPGTLGAAGMVIPGLDPFSMALLGYARDKGGREFAAQGLAKIGERAKNIRDNSPPGPIRQILNKAFRTGGDGAVLMYHNLLMEKDPKYREAMSEY